MLGNQGRTIAAPLLSEAGDTWVNDGSALKLWSNLIDQVLTGGCPPSPATVVKRFGFPANPDAFQATAGSQPLLGKVFSCHVDHTTFMPGAILDVVSMSLGQMNLSTIHGTLLVDPTQQIGFQFTSAGQVFDLKAPFDCAFAGLTVSLQVGSVAVDALELTNSLDLTLGTQ